MTTYIGIITCICMHIFRYWNDIGEIILNGSKIKLTKWYYSPPPNKKNINGKFPKLKERDSLNSNLDLAAKMPYHPVIFCTVTVLNEIKFWWNEIYWSAPCYVYI